MIRLLGILVGSAFAIAALLMLIGKPAVNQAPDPEPAQQRFALPDPVESVPEPVTALPEADVQEEPEPVLEASADAFIEQPVPAAILPEPEAIIPEEPEPPRWHAFWSPFRSQIAANGFISQLQTVTALDYRVVAIKPGVYEVAFAYQDDAEIAESLAQISAATGLDVPDS